jgi:hypothetical protein
MVTLKNGVELELELERSGLAEGNRILLHLNINKTSFDFFQTLAVRALDMRPDRHVSP